MTERKLQFLEPAGAAERKNLSLRLLGLAVVSTLVASTCCLLPLALVLVGITGAWMTTLTSLQPVTPIFIGIAVVTLGWAGYLVFRPVTECSASEAEACGKTRRSTRWIFLICASFIAALLLFPLFAPLFY